MGATLFAIAVSIVIAGWLWFFIVRPILEDWGVLSKAESVNSYENSDPVIMSRSQESAAEYPASSLQTDGRRTPDRPMMPVPTSDEMLDIFKVLRAAGVKRDALSGAWRAAGLKMDNNLWSQAAPPPQEPAAVTPIAGRPTSAKFHDDPELEYRPLG